MIKISRSNKGQSILSEYTMIFFAVIAMIVAVSTFVQRSLEGRIHDARNFSITSIINSSLCDTNCMQATGGNIAYEYEPYYTIMSAQSRQSQNQVSEAMPGNAQFIGVIYNKILDEQTVTNANSVQLAPEWGK